MSNHSVAQLWASPSTKVSKGVGRGQAFLFSDQKQLCQATVLNSGRRGDLAGPRNKRREDQRRVQGGEAKLSRVWAVSEWGR